MTSCSGSQGAAVVTLWSSSFNVAAADIVACQVGCISHNAGWCVKAHCKRCVFVTSAGVVSFGRAVDDVVD